MSSPWPKGYIVVVDMWSESHWKENTLKSSNTSDFYDVLKSGAYFYNYLKPFRLYFKKFYLKVAIFWK